MFPSYWQGLMFSERNDSDLVFVAVYDSNLCLTVAVALARLATQFAATLRAVSTPSVRRQGNLRVL